GAALRGVLQLSTDRAAPSLVLVAARSRYPEHGEQVRLPAPRYSSSGGVLVVGAGLETCSGAKVMFTLMRRIIVGAGVAAAAASGALATVSAQAPTVKVTDPTSVVMIVNRDSNDIGFMDIKTKKMIAN